MLSECLVDLDAAYGDLPAHDGLWQAAQETAHDLLAFLAIAPLVLETRGLDITPVVIDRLREVDDDASANASAFYQPMSERSDLFAPPTEAG